MRLSLAVAIALTGGACVLGDLFGPDGPDQLELRLARGQNINVPVPGKEAFTVTLEADGTPVRNAQVTLTISDPLKVTFFDGAGVLVRASPVQDSLTGLAEGCATLEARYENSMLGGTAITGSWQIRVGGGGACQP